LMKELGYGKEYAYSHDNQDKLHEQEFLPAELVNTRIYTPFSAKREDELRSYLNRVWKGKYGY
jgi:putative ATPase